MLEDFTEWDGRKFEFTGEYQEDVIPHSRRVAMRNRKRVWLPVFRCEATGDWCVRADLAVENKESHKEI